MIIPIVGSYFYYCSPFLFFYITNLGSTILFYSHCRMGLAISLFVHPPLHLTVYGHRCQVFISCGHKNRHPAHNGLFDLHLWFNAFILWSLAFKRSSEDLCFGSAWSVGLYFYFCISIFPKEFYDGLFLILHSIFPFLFYFLSCSSLSSLFSSYF